MFSIAIWKQRNTELHGTDGAISMEQRRKETATEAVAVYHSTIGMVSQTDSVVLHHSRIEILKWTKEHLDAYLLASADVIIDQRDEPGLLLSFLLGCIDVCVVDRESYGSDRCTSVVLVLIGKHG
jgi:hypothetical protein